MPTRPAFSSDTTEPVRWESFHSDCRQIAFQQDAALRDYMEKQGVRWAGVDYLKRKFKAGTPCSGTHVVWLPFSGALECDHGSGFRPLLPDAIAICPARHPHWVRLAAPTASGLWLHFEQTPRWSRFFEITPGVYPNLALGHLDALVNAYLLPRRTPGAGDLGAKIQALELLLFSLEQALDQIAGGRRLEFETKIAALEARILEKIDADWTVAALAAVLNLSPSHLHKILLKHGGLTPMGLVTRQRMNQAMSRLLHTNMTLAAIAEEIGFANAFAFSNAFKRELGLSPAQFRTSELKSRPEKTSRRRPPKLKR